MLTICILFGFSGCNLFFKGETKTTSLRVFNNSSSLRLKTLPRENCEVTQEGTAFVNLKGWQPVKSSQPPFMIHHEDKNRDKHAHFLEASIQDLVMLM